MPSPISANHLGQVESVSITKNAQGLWDITTPISMDAGTDKNSVIAWIVAYLKDDTTGTITTSQGEI